eukprot:248519_1
MCKFISACLFIAIYIATCNGVTCPMLNEKQKAACRAKVTTNDIDSNCPNKPTILLMGPTRHGKSFYANLLLDHADNAVPEDAVFEDSVSELSVTSSIKCRCGDKYRVCDSPGIPDLCGQADKYLDRIINFIKESSPNMILFVLDATSSLHDFPTEPYYKALRLCFTDFSQINTYILLNKITSRPRKFKKNIAQYNEKLMLAANSLGISYLNNITHPYDKFELTENAQKIINGLVNDPPFINTNNYKSFTDLINDIEQCGVDNLIGDLEEKIRIKQTDKDWYESRNKWLVAATFSTVVVGAGTAVFFCPSCVTAIKSIAVVSLRAMFPNTYALLRDVVIDPNTTFTDTNWTLIKDRLHDDLKLANNLAKNLTKSAKLWYNQFYSVFTQLLAETDRLENEINDLKIRLSEAKKITRSQRKKQCRKKMADIHLIAKELCIENQSLIKKLDRLKREL